MNLLNSNGQAWIGVLIAVVAVGVILFLVLSPNTPTDNQKYNGPQTTWSQYENTELGFALEHPEDMSVTHEGPSNTVVKFQTFGPTQTQDTEVFDGLSFFVQKHSVGSPSDLETYANNEFEDEKNDPFFESVISSPQETEIGGMSAYMYELQTIAESRHYIVEHSDGSYFEVSYIAPDPTLQGFQNTAERMVSSFTLLE